MNVCYPTTASTRNSVLPRALYRTLNLLLDLARKHGYAWPTNDWLASRLDYTPRTITRHIAALERAGHISTERIANERHIRPATPPTPAKVTRPNATLPKCNGNNEMSTRCLPPSIEGVTKENNIPEQAANPENPLVVALVAHGVDRAQAVKLADKNADECRQQLEAVKEQNGIRDRAAWLVDAIRNAWKHKPKKQVSATPRVKRQAEPTPQSAEPQSADAAAWNALSAEHQESIRKAVQARLHPSIRHRAQIIQAHCLQWLRNAQERPAEPPGNPTPPV